MGKGLKTSVKEALAEETLAEETAKRPVKVSHEAMLVLNTWMREWSGWPKAITKMGEPIKAVSPWAMTDYANEEFTFNVDELLLNPNRVLLTVTPFRLRQEAVLTGTMLHEAGHARYSLWRPRKVEDMGTFRHSNGDEVTQATMSLALLCEEPRVEGLMARDARANGTTGLGWTMRASAAKLVPFTSLSQHHDQQVMDLISSWVLRAGRRIALSEFAGVDYNRWVHEFTSLLQETLVAHFTATNPDPNSDPYGDARYVIDLLRQMMCWDGSSTSDVPLHTGSFMIDTARYILRLLFPETPEEEMPSPSGGCESGTPEDEESDSESGDEGEGDESGADGDGNTEPEDEGEGEGEGESESEKAERESLNARLAALENAAKDNAEDEEQAGAAGGVVDEEETDEGEEETESFGAGVGSGVSNGRWRQPTAAERDVQKGAERFLRDLIDTSESSVTSLVDTPSATVDGAAMAAWKAAGGIKAPHFFRQTRRETQPSPPVQIAVLADVSSSMDELQKPTALLSWALSAAALDLRNFAGRGTQVESCLIHWGATARVIAENGKVLPGLREWECAEGTYAMGAALDLVDEQMPGFFDPAEQPVNRLLVQFTDWEFLSIDNVAPKIQAALANGVNMLSVVPNDFRMDGRSMWNALPKIMEQCTIQRGRSVIMKYNTLYPERVWDEAARVLNLAQIGREETPAPFEGF